MQVDDTFEVLVDRPVAGGRSLARHEGQVVLVAGAISGERVQVRVERITKQVAFAATTEVVDASPDRRAPICDPACGRSSFAHVKYERQLTLKGEIVLDALRRIGKITFEGPVAVEPSIERGYRMRARLHVRGGRIGFFREGTHDLCDAIATGQLLPASLAAIEDIRAGLGNRLADCDAMVLAENVAASDRVVHLEPKEGSRLDDLVGGFPPPRSVSGITTVAVRSRSMTIAGSPALTDKAIQVFDGDSPIGDAVAWTRHAGSFFQGNRYLVGALVRRVLELAEGDRFVDLYAGVGLFAVALAARGMRGFAVESDPSSGADLNANAGRWRDHLRAVRSTVEDAVKTPLDPPPHVVILDPPRTGMSPEAMTGVLAWKAPRILYVSCDPPTFARDAARLIAGGYRLQSIDGFDLFPNTAHVETIALFAR